MTSARPGPTILLLNQKTRRLPFHLHSQSAFQLSISVCPQLSRNSSILDPKMKLTLTFSAVLAVLAIINVANADPMCTPMSDKEKAMYEKTFDTDFMGCTLSMKESMTALSRIHWMTPADGMPVVEMDYSSDVDMSDIGKAGAPITTGMKVAAASSGRPGMMTVSTECMMSLEPDYVYSCMAKSKTPKEYNAHLAAACKKTSSRTITTSVRSTEDAIATGTAVICIITALIGLFFPALSPTLLDGLKEIVVTTFTILPCPSMTPMPAP